MFCRDLTGQVPGEAALATSNAASPDSFFTENGQTMKTNQSWGGRFAEGPKEAVAQYTDSQSYDRALYAQDIRASQAHARMLGRQGVISQNEARILVNGLDRVREEIEAGNFVWKPELEDVLRVLGAKRWDVLIKVGLPRSMPYFYASLKVAITLAFVGTTVSEMTASNEGIGYLLISAGSSMQMGLAFAGLLVVGAMAMAMYELFSWVEKRTTAWAHRGSQNH